MSKRLFEDFEAVSSKAWKQKIQVDLKGADYNETLIWKTNEGIDVKPFYHADAFDTFTTHLNNNSWLIGQEIGVNDASSGNTKAIDALKRGAEHIQFIISNEDIDLNALLQDIDISTVKVTLQWNFQPSDQYLNQYKSVLDTSNVTCLYDCIHQLASSGNWYQSLKDDLKTHSHYVSASNTLHVDARLYQNAGANIIQQLAYTLAHCNEYLNQLDIEDKNEVELVFSVAVGSNYFFEIAKLRALRMLWSSLADAYGYNANCQIIAIPSKRNKTIYDYNTNMLRTTTECMSAVIGGADIVINLPYDSIYHKSNEFGDRISRNQLLVLKHESYFDKVNNTADGSYYIESLTSQLANKALDLFKQIEAAGGFLSQLKDGKIQMKIKESANKEQDTFDSGDLVLLGTNKHPNPNDKMKQDLEIDPFLKVEARKTLIAPITVRRLAEPMEQKRLKDEE